MNSVGFFALTFEVPLRERSVSSLRIMMTCLDETRHHSSQICYRLDFAVYGLDLEVFSAFFFVRSVRSSYKQFVLPVS